MVRNGIKLRKMDAKEELYDLKRLIEIRNEIKKRFQIWDEKKNVSSLIIEKLHTGDGKTTIDEDIVGRFNSTEEAKEFLEIFAVIHGYAYHSDKSSITSGEISRGISKLEEKGSKEPEGITENEIRRIIDIANNKEVTDIEDAIGYYDEPDASERIKKIFKIIDDKNENYRYIKNILINLNKLDEKILRKEILNLAKKNQSEISINIGQEIGFTPDEQINIVRNTLNKYTDVEINPDTNESIKLLEYFFKKYEIISMDKSKMKYKITANDFWD